jgi:CheY-like chemotaxis protein
MKFEDIDFNIFKSAIDIYLDIAYPNGIKENSFCYKNIETLKKATNLSDVLSVFEKQKISTDGSDGKVKYVVRLGSEKYPFMKLVLLETDKKDEFGFLIDRHTEYLALMRESHSFEEEVRIKAYSKEIKYKIEEEFHKNHIPTYRDIIKKVTHDLMFKFKTADVHKNGIKVLIVEDDEDISNLYRVSLELLGYTVSQSFNGEDALNKVSHEFNNIMMLDLMMPMMSGFEVIKRVADEISIIVVTSLSDFNSKKECIKNGAKAVLVKPVEPVLIDKTIQKILNINN